MEEKVVCYYCGTIYDESRKKCPLCGSSATTGTSPAPAPRRRVSEEERRQRQRPERTGAKKKSPGIQLSPRAMKIAALVFLILTVLVVFYFIGDMIGWWPGLENRVERETPSVSIPSTDCELLELSSDVLGFESAGQTRKLTVSVNLSCGKTVYCNSSDESIVTISAEAETEEGIELKSATFIITSIGEGEAELVIKCGDMTATCKVYCGEEYWSEPPTEPFSVPEDYEPQLNYPDITLTEDVRTATLEVTNLPEDASVLWTSADPEIATVSADGIVTAAAAGTTTITAEVGGKIAQITVHCDLPDATAEGAHLDSGRSDVTAYVGDRFDLFLYDSNGDHIDDITYTVEDPSICKVEDNYVIALSPGTTVVTITYAGQEFKCIVRVY